MNKHFWNWARDETNPEERTLLLEGPIAEESWYPQTAPSLFPSTRRAAIPLPLRRSTPCSGNTQTT